MTSIECFWEVEANVELGRSGKCGQLSEGVWQEGGWAWPGGDMVLNRLEHIWMQGEAGLQDTRGRNQWGRAFEEAGVGSERRRRNYPQQLPDWWEWPSPKSTTVGLRTMSNRQDTLIIYIYCVEHLLVLCGWCQPGRPHPGLWQHYPDGFLASSSPFQFITWNVVSNESMLCPMEYVIFFCSSLKQMQLTNRSRPSTQGSIKVLVSLLQAMLSKQLLPFSLSWIHWWLQLKVGDRVFNIYKVFFSFDTCNSLWGGYNH